MLFLYRREKNRTKVVKISYKFEKNLRNDQRKFDYFQKIEKLSLALLKSHSQSERLNPNVADIWFEH